MTALTTLVVGTAQGEVRPLKLIDNLDGTYSPQVGLAVEPTIDIGNVNVTKLGGAAISTNTGVMDAGTQRVTLATDGPTVNVLGSTSGAAVITDAAGSIQQYLRGLVKQWIAGTLSLGTSTNAIGKVNHNPGAAQLTVAAINFSSSGNNTLVSAGAGSVTIKVYAIYLMVANATNLTFADGVITDGALPFAANEAMVLGFNGEPWFTGAAATAFILNSSAAVQVAGRIYYIKS